MPLKWYTYCCQQYVFQRHCGLRTIPCPIKQVGLYARETVPCIPLQPHYRRERLRWCKEHIGWGHQQKSRVMFCNQFSFTVISDSAHQLLLGKRRTCLQSIMLVNVIGMTEACWCGQPLCTMAEHRLTSLSEATLQWSDVAKRLFLIMFVFLGIR